MRLPYFPGSRVAWDSSTFLQIDLTNIKHYLYFFFLTLRIHESPNFLVLKQKHAPLISMQDAKLFYLLPDMNHFFWTRLTFFSSPSMLFGFFFSITDASSAFFIILMLFSFLQALEILDGRLTWREARPLIFHAKHGLSISHGKTHHPLFDSLPFAFPETFPISRTFPHFSHFHA